MNFRTEIKLKPFPFAISHTDKLLLMGSCFAENIGTHLTQNKFDVEINPFGTLYNPASISKSLERLVRNQPFSQDQLFEHEGVYHSFWHHSRFSGTDANQVITAMNVAQNEASNQLLNANVLIITLGTAWVYRHLATDTIVSNCHKLPAGQFKKFALSVSEVTDYLASAIEKAIEANPKISIMVTVSPIRHLSDGFAENQSSKSTLILASHALVNRFKSVCYFPAFEIMMDDLRDYRFYADDMVHPNQLAIDYIWNTFATAFFSPETQALNVKIQKIRAASQHRPFNKNTLKHQDFIKATLEQMAQLKQRYNWLDFSSEESLLKS